MSSARQARWSRPCTAFAVTGRMCSCATCACPSLSNLATMQLIRERVARTKIVLATMELNPAFAQLALAAGATGFVSKDLADSELVPAVRAAAIGTRYVSPRVTRSLGSRPAAQTV